jgi:hypothetical protein
LEIPEKFASLKNAKGKPGKSERNRKMRKIFDFQKRKFIILQKLKDVTL